MVYMNNMIQTRVLNINVSSIKNYELSDKLDWSDAKLSKILTTIIWVCKIIIIGNLWTDFTDQ